MERFILTEKEQQVFKLCSCLLNKDSSGMSFEEIIKEIGLSKTTINYAISKLRQVLNIVIGEDGYLLYKSTDTLYLEVYQSISFQMLKNKYISGVFFLHFFQEVYHERFSSLMKEVDAKFMSYETGKKELVKCRAYMKHFSLQLFTKRKVENMIDGEEKQIRFMFFCMVLSQFQCKFIDFFESENIQLNLFLDNIVKAFPFIFQSSKLKIKIFYRIALDRIEKGHLLPEDMIFPSYFECPVLSLKMFTQRVEMLFIDLDLTAQQKKLEIDFLYFLFCTLIYQPAYTLEGIDCQDNDCLTFINTIETIGGMTLTSKEKQYVCYAHKQCIVWHQMFHVSFCFHHLMTEQERFTEKNSDYMLLWNQIALALQEVPIYHDAFLQHPNMTFFFQRIFNTISFSREIPCKVFLLCYSAITQSIAMENLKNRQLTIKIDFVNTIEEADIVISELDLPDQEPSPKHICFVNLPLDLRDWKNIENTIIKWRTSE
jgi:biotin operon repressor